MLTSLRIELVRSRHVYFQSVLHEGRPSSQPLLVPESPLQAQVPSPVGSGVWGDSVVVT